MEEDAFFDNLLQNTPDGNIKVMENNTPSDLPGNNLDNFLNLEVQENNPHLVLQRFSPSENLLISLLAKRFHDGLLTINLPMKAISTFMLHSFWWVYFKLC